MRDFGDHAANFRRVDALGDAMHLAEPERLERLAHFDRAADSAADLTDAQHLRVFVGFLLIHEFHASASAGSSSIPRSDLYSASLRSCLSASNVALTTLCGFAVPRDFVRMFCMPADSRIARTGPPAMTPVPSEAGLSSTLPAP